MIAPVWASAITMPVISEIASHFPLGDQAMREGLGGTSGKRMLMRWPPVVASQICTRFISKFKTATRRLSDDQASPSNPQLVGVVYSVWPHVLPAGELDGVVVLTPLVPAGTFGCISCKTVTRLPTRAIITSTATSRLTRQPNGV